MIIVIFLPVLLIKASNNCVGNKGSFSSLKYNFSTPAIELISLPSCISSKGSIPVNERHHLLLQPLKIYKDQRRITASGVLFISYTFPHIPFTHH